MSQSVLHCTMRTLFLPERVLAHEVLGALPEAPTGKRPVRILDLLQGVWVERVGIGGRNENLYVNMGILL